MNAASVNGNRIGGVHKSQELTLNPREGPPVGRDAYCSSSPCEVGSVALRTRGRLSPTCEAFTLS